MGRLKVEMSELRSSVGVCRRLECDVQVLEQTLEWTNRVEVHRGRRLGLSIETVPSLIEMGVFQFRSIGVK